MTGLIAQGDTTMSERRVNLLHVEDDEMQRRLMVSQLGTLDGLRFNIIYAATEDEAADAFTRARFDLVIVDYQLEQGNGLKCLQKIRRRDAVVPIIAVSGTATPAIAKDLLRVGADDFLSKADLSSEILGQSVRAALTRADRWRRHLPEAVEDKPSQVEGQLQQLCKRFVEGLGAEWLGQLDAVDTQIREGRITSAALQTMFELAAGDVNTRGPASGNAAVFLRPLWLELVVRQSGTQR
jgi:CheY-like chemotaxis protein